MKKIIKRILITLLVIGVTGGGLYGGYAYRQSKKTAKVVLASSVGQTEYWMDNVESYGQVTSDKSQMGYLPKHAEVLSLNVKEGDHVEAGDVILSVKNASITADCFTENSAALLECLSWLAYCPYAVDNT